MKIGIDVGSTGIKTVFLSDDAKILWKKVVPTRPGQSAVVDELIRQGLETLGADPGDIEKTCVTGYGRKLISASDQVVDEITANAAGIHHQTRGQARTLINIGGQDVKIITLSGGGQVLDFRMNDKCAAGTGRFLEITARILDTPLEAFEADADVEPASINATCAVFAESEIVSLIAKDTDKAAIIKGVHHAVAKRIANLAGSSPLEEAVYADGGPALSRGLIQSLEDVFLCDIHVTEAPQFTVAVGAVLAAG